MSEVRSVRVDPGPYAAAVAELPLRARLGSATAGSIVVIGGEAGWGARLRSAVDEGAAAIILAQPQEVVVAEFLAAGRPAIPVIVDRARLRSDSAADARPEAPPIAVQVECGAPSTELATVLCDALGWARALAGGALELRSARITSRAVQVELEHDAVAVSVLLGRRDSRTPWLRALAIDRDRVEVTLPHPVGSPVVVRSNIRGSLRVPPRLESPERLALRRALDAVGTQPDLEDLEHDARLALGVLAGDLMLESY